MTDTLATQVATELNAQQNTDTYTQTSVQADFASTSSNGLNDIAILIARIASLKLQIPGN